MVQFDDNLLSDMLPIFYNRLFPQNLFSRWLSAGSSPQPLANRELSFTLADDVYLRYLSFSNQKELQALLQKKCPYKIDIGAVYNTKPSIARHGSVVLTRELVFDIDMTDYDEVRTCCQEAKVCQKCWRFMSIACEVIDAALREDFGFKHIVWVFSGRRGIHCWVSDYEARTLDSPGRAALADYLCLISGGETAKRVNLNGDLLHSSIRRALRIINEHFNEIVTEQNFFSTPKGLKKLVSMIPSDIFAQQVEKKLELCASKSSLEIWNTFIQMFESYWRESGNNRKIKYLIEEIQLHFCYPRLDVNVTKGANHLLKSPYSVHPKTGNVCVVFKAINIRNFKLDEVPSLATLLDEMAPEHIQHRSALQASIKLFQEQVFALEKDEAKRKRLAADSSLNDITF